MAEFDRNLAVIIGINEYQEQLGIKKLKAARPDAEKLDEILREQGYEVDLLVDEQATFDGITNFLTTILPEKIKTDRRVRLLFYFAGHGTTPQDEEGEAGYLIPQDAEPSNRGKFISMRWVHDELTKLSCHHLLIILDCCFAGAFRFTTRHFGIIPEEISKQRYDRYINHRAWQVITSAAHDQKAVDILWDNRGISEDSIHSPFAEALFKALEKQAADYTKDGITTATELYLYLNDVLLRQNPDKPQVPRFWPLKEHDKGEFIFLTGEFDEDKLPEAPALSENNNPYRGLESFDEAHSKFFFGREELVAELKQHLYLPEQSFTVVLGVSGSGKSSLVKAGLIPELRKEEKTKWRILEPIRPTADPFNALSRTMLSLVQDSEESEWQLLEQLDELLKQARKRLPQDRDLAELLSTWRRSSPIDKLWLIIHRFEQLNKWFDREVDRRSLQNLRQIGLNRSQLVLEHFETLRTPLLSESERQQVEAFYQSCVDLLQTWSQNWKSDRQQFSSFVRDWCQSNSSWRLLLVVDQFEELVTQCDKDVREVFLDLLGDVLKVCPEQLRVVATLRADFEPRFIDSEQLKPYWDKARFLMRAMRSDELRRAIEGPALEHILYFETERDRNLVDQLIDEVGQMPGALPLLSFALSEIYREYVRQDDVQDRTLKWQHYRKVGGVAGSLTRRATEEFDRLLKDENLVKDKDGMDVNQGGFGEEKGKAYQASMRRVMLRMVMTEGTYSTRRQASMSELVYPYPTENERVEEAINRLVYARLLVKGQKKENTSDIYVEPSHDFLISGWDQLKNWIEKEKEDLLLQRRLTPAALEWESIKNTDKEQPKNLLDKTLPIFDLLDRGLFSVENIVSKIPVQFARLLRRDQNQQGNLRLNSIPIIWLLLREINSLAGILFLRKSQVRLREKPTQFLWDGSPYLGLLDKELHSDDNWLNDVEGKFVQESVLKKRRDTSWWWRGAIGVISGLSVLTVFALIQENLASNREKIARARQLAAQAELLRGSSGASLVKSLLLSVQSLKEKPTTEGDQALRRGLALFPHSNTCTLSRDKVSAVSFSPEGKYFASISPDKTVRVWETVNCHLLTSWVEDEKKFFGEVGAEISNISISLSSDGKYIGIAGNTILRVRNVRSHQKIADINPGFSIDKLSISPDGKYIAVATRKIAQIWEVALHRKIGNDYSYNDEDIPEIKDIALSNLGKHLAVIFDGDDGTFLDIHNVKEATHQAIFVSGQSLVMSFSPDGKYLATAGDDFDLDGNGITLIKIFEDVAEWKEIATFRQDEIPNFIAFSSRLKIEVEGGINNRYFATGSKSTSRIWKIDGLGRTELVALIPSENPLALAFSPNAEFLNIVSSKDNNDKSEPFYVTLNKWQVNSNSQVLTVNPDFGPRNYIEALAFSSDGQTLTGIGSEKQNSWKMKDGENFISRPLDLGSASSPSLSPDGKFIVWNFLDTVYWMNLANDQRKEFSLPQKGISIGPIAISSEGKYLAVASGKVVSLLNGENITQSLSPSLSGDVIAVTFSLDGDFLAVATKNTVDIWKCYKNSCYTFKRISLNSEINKVALSKDAKYLAIVSGKIVEVRQVSNTQIIARIENNLTLNAIAFSWDDRYLATANKNEARTITSEDSIAKVWLLMPQDLSQEACSRLTRNLTSLEWQQYLEGLSYQKTCPNLP